MHIKEALKTQLILNPSPPCSTPAEAAYFALPPGSWSIATRYHAAQKESEKRSPQGAKFLHQAMWTKLYRAFTAAMAAVAFSASYIKFGLVPASFNQAQLRYVEALYGLLSAYSRKNVSRNKTKLVVLDMLHYIILSEVRHITTVSLSALGQCKATLYVWMHATSIQCDQEKVSSAIDVDHTVRTNAI